MKIRSGFVSNSSSSSFIVAFPKRPDSDWECRELMFGTVDWSQPSDYNDTMVNAELGKYEAAVAVFKELCGHRALSKKDAREILGSTPIGQFYSKYPEYPEQSADESNEEHDKQLDKYYNEIERINKRELNRFLEENSGGFIFSFYYGDEDGRFWGLMEHSDIFGKLPHLTISHH